MMISRDLITKLGRMAQKFPVVTLTGPRQSGKTMLLRHVFQDYRYVSLEDLDMREFAQNDPRGFLSTYGNRVIIDEAQRVPSLFSYIQGIVDHENREGMFILAGSHNFLLMEQVNQSLAGRTAVLKLLPLSHHELKKEGLATMRVEEEIFKGGYPRIFDKGIDPGDFYPHYMETYLERDVRLLKNIGDLSKFILFVKMCAGRVGQLLNLSSLANDCSISVPTATSWLSVLEASFICYRLQPNYKNYSKRLVKTPKLYFYDTGLVCSLLGIRSAEQLTTHYLYGGLFENLVVNEFVKLYYNQGIEPDLTFWRDSTGNEIDLIDHREGEDYAYEIKSSQTFKLSFFKGLNRWASLSGSKHCSVIYAGGQNLTTSDGALQSWNTLFE